MPTQPLLGQIMPVAFGARIPDGWALCDGAPLDISTNPALFTLLGIAFGGDGIKSFKLPDLRGRAAIGLGTLPLGASTGQPTVAISPAELPAHTHRLNASTAPGFGRGAVSPANKVFAASTSGETIFGRTGSAEVPLADATNVERAGGGQPHENMQPFLTINYMIALTGQYPIRG